MMSDVAICDKRALVLSSRAWR